MKNPHSTQYQPAIAWENVESVAGFSQILKSKYDADVKSKIHQSINILKISKTTEKAILSLKKEHVNIKINNLRKNIEDGGFGDDDIKELNRLTKIKTEISKVLGRNIE